MEASSLKIGEALKEGWRLTKDHLAFFIGYQLILYVLCFLYYSTPATWKWAPGHLLVWVLILLAKMGFYNSALLITIGIKPGLDQLYSNWRRLIPWIIANFLFGFMVTLGFILLIVPGCYIWARYGFYPFFILDKDSGPIESFERAGGATKGIRWPIFLLFCACLGLNLLGLLFFGIGLLFTLPTTLLALATVYRRIVLSDLKF